MIADLLGEYYRWKDGEFRSRECRIAVAVKAGVRMPDMATRLLADHVSVVGAANVLDLNCGTGVVGACVAIRMPDLSLALADRNIVNVEAAKRVVEANAIKGAKVYFSNGTTGLPRGSPCDAVTIRLPKGRIPLLQLLWDAFNVLRSGGECYLAGANAEGIKSAISRMEELYGNARTLGYGAGSRVAVGVKSSDAPCLPSSFTEAVLEHSLFHEYRIGIRGRELVVKSRPGVFAYERLDEGSRCLIEHMDIAANERVLDFGCGSGVVGAVAATLAPNGHVHLVDADCEAIRSAEETIKVNGLKNCTVVASDCGEQICGLSFDAVVTNPPFHLSHKAELSMVHQLIRDSASLLQTNGRLILVANRTLPYEKIIERVFGRIRTMHKDSRYKVLLADHPHRG